MLVIDSNITKAVSSAIDSDIAKALLPAIAAVCAALIAAAVSWAKDLNVTARRSRILEQCTKRVEFWEGWAKALETVAEPRSEDRLRAEAEIRKAADAVKTQFHNLGAAERWTASEFIAYRNSLSAWKRLFLLYEQPIPRARRLRSIGYLSLVVLPVYDYVLVFQLHLRIFGVQLIAFHHRMLWLLYGILCSIITFLYVRHRIAKIEKFYWGIEPRRRSW